MAETRTLDELLKLETYQGMSDDEIQLLIDFRCRVASEAAVSDALSEATFEHVELVRDALNRSRAHSKALFDAAISMTPVFRTVQDG